MSHTSHKILLHLYSVPSESSPIFADFSRNILGVSVFYNLFLFSFPPLFFSFFLPSLPPVCFFFSSFYLFLSLLVFFNFILEPSTHEYFLSPCRQFFFALSYCLAVARTPFSIWQEQIFFPSCSFFVKKQKGVERLRFTCETRSVTPRKYILLGRSGCPLHMSDKCQVTLI